MALFDEWYLRSTYAALLGISVAHVALSAIEAYANESGWSTLWSRTGNQGRNWLDAAVVLPASTTQVRFNGLTGVDWRSDMALDDIALLQRLDGR